MDIHIKPVVWTAYPDDKPDWILYKTGEYNKPIIILRDAELENLIQEYCKQHGMMLKEKD